MKRLFILAIFLMASVLSFGQATKTDRQEINLIETLKASGNFNTFLAALRKSGLIDTLKGAGPFTVFAPTDQAFEKLPQGVLSSVRRDRTKLKTLLLYHVAPGRLSIEDLLSRPGKSITMMESTTAEIQDNGFSYAGSEPQLRVVDEAFRLGTSRPNDRLRSAEPRTEDKIQDNGFTPTSASPIVINKFAHIIKGDLGASNGTIHVVDTVLSKGHLPILRRKNQLINSNAN